MAGLNTCDGEVEGRLETGGSGITGGMLVSWSLEGLRRVPGGEHGGEK